jgi:hypothetical protein
MMNILIALILTLTMNNNVRTSIGEFDCTLTCTNEFGQVEEFHQFKADDGQVWWLLSEEEIGEEPCGKYLLVFDDKGTTAENKPCDCPTEYECECEVYDDELIAVIPLKRA